MEKKQSCVLKLSLEEICLRRVVVDLWNQTDILASIVNFRINGLNDCERQNAWRETVEDKVKVKVSELVVAEVLKKQMLHIIKPIGNEIQSWKRFHEKCLSDSIEELGVPILEKLCWTSSGMIEYKKTAEKLIHCEMVDVVERYKLACLYCLEDYIPVFWEKLPEGIKSTFYDRENTLYSKQPSLQFVWPYILKGEESKLVNTLARIPGNSPIFHRLAFERSSFTGNKAAAEYFLQKLTNEGEEAPLFRAACGSAVFRRVQCLHPTDPGRFPMERNSEVLCYLLPLLTPEQLMDVLRKQPFFFLSCFLDWPWQYLFAEMAGLVCSFYSERDYNDLLQTMRLDFNYPRYYLRKLFQEFIIHSPIDFKKRFVNDECRLGSFLPNFFDLQDSETIKVIFRNVDVDDKVKLVSSCAFFKLVGGLTVGDKWDLVELCLREATLSKEDVERLKAGFMEFLTEDDKPQEWERFFQSLDEIYGSTSKRSSEVEAPTEPKKLRLED